MIPEDIGKAYNQISHIWNSEEFDMSNGILQRKKAISFVKNRGNALDVGCGCTGRIIDLLLDEGFTPSGLDVSDEMIRIAREKHPGVSFTKADICEYELSEKYDFVTAWDSIWHIPLAEQKSVITKIVDSLNVTGVFIFSFGGTDKAGSHTKEPLIN